MIIDISDLHFQYPLQSGMHRFELRIPRLQVQKGEMWAIVGPSGCGKSTLLNLIAAELQSQSGKIQVLDTDLSQMNHAQRQSFRIQNIGFVFQDFPLVPYLNALENLLFPYRINPSLELNNAIRLRAIELLDKVGLQNKDQHFPKQLSQGERQRVAIARALMTNPNLILADEPTAGLDHQRAQEIMSLLDAIVQERKIALIVVTHDLEVQKRYANVLDFANLQRFLPSSNSEEGNREEATQ